MPRFNQSNIETFIRERQYLTNVSPRTIEWYRNSLRWLPNESPTQAELNDAVIRMREKGNRPTGVNSVIRCLNAYLHWSSGADRKCGAGCTHLRIAKLKEPAKIPETFTEPQVRSLVTWRPRTPYQRRLHLLALFLLDTGARISELLTLHISDIDFDNLLITLDGKGRKQRVVPFSFALRKAMYKWVSAEWLKSDDLLLGTSNHTHMGRRNVLRDVNRLCHDLGFKPPHRTVHAFRHTFAVNYLRRGGSVFHLQKCLGHSSLEMSRRYANLATSDLQAVHERISLLRP
jgi:integrase/recombinase XerD